MKTSRLSRVLLLLTYWTIFAEGSVKQSTKEVIVRPYSIVPQTVSFEICDNIVESYSPKLKIILDGNIDSSTIAGPFPKNEVLLDGRDGVAASIWDNFNDSNCDILVVRLWPSDFINVTNVSIVLDLSTFDEARKRLMIHNLSDAHRIDFLFLDGTEPTVTNEGLTIETSTTEVMLELNDTVPQIVSFLVHGRPEEFHNLHYDVKNVSLGSVSGNIKSYHDVPRYEDSGIAAYIWNSTVHEGEQYQEVIVVVWPFRLSAENLTISLELTVAFTFHNLSGMHRINFYFRSVEEASATTPAATTDVSTTPEMSTVGTTTPAATTDVSTTPEMSTVGTTTDVPPVVEKPFINSTVGQSVLAVIGMIVGGILITGTIAVVIVIMKRRKSSASNDLEKSGADLDQSK